MIIIETITYISGNHSNNSAGYCKLQAACDFVYFAPLSKYVETIYTKQCGNQSVNCVLVKRANESKKHCIQIVRLSRINLPTYIELRRVRHETKQLECFMFVSEPQIDNYL